MADRVSRSMATPIVYAREFWLQSIDLSKEVQSTIEALHFEGNRLLNQNIDEALDSLKDSRATLHFLGIHTLAPKRKSTGNCICLDQHCSLSFTRDCTNCHEHVRGCDETSIVLLLPRLTNGNCLSKVLLMRHARITHLPNDRSFHFQYPI